MKYGQLPEIIGIYQVKGQEMMFYQYLPIKIRGDVRLMYEPRLRNHFGGIVEACMVDFMKKYGHDEYFESYMYLTAKCMYQSKNSSFNRFGWHSDGFMTDDVNYIWCNRLPQSNCAEIPVLFAFHLRQWICADFYFLLFGMQ